MSVGKPSDQLRAAAQQRPAPEQKRILDIGCGRNKRPGAIGLDRVPLPGVDVTHDLDQFPYPFPDNSFDEVWAVHVIEHLDSILRAMEEVHRLCRPGARVTIITPHHSDAISWQDPTHKWHLNSRSFAYFDPDYESNYYTKVRFQLVDRQIEMATVWKYLGIQTLVNADNRFPALRFIRKLWEQHLCFVLRAKQMTFELIALK